MCVEIRVAVVNAAKLFDFSRKVQHGLGQRRFPRVHMSQNTYNNIFLHG